MEGAQLEGEDGKCTNSVILMMTKKEAKALSTMVDAAVEKKVKGAKPIQKKIYRTLICY